MFRITAVWRRRKSLTAVAVDPEAGWTELGGKTDGSGLLLLDAELCALRGVAPGAELSESGLLELIAESAKIRAKSRALYLLSRRDYGERELLRKLEPEFGAEAAGYAVARMAGLSLVDDRKYARKLAAQYLDVKRVSARQTVSLITAKGIDRQLAEEAVELQDADPLKQIAELIGRKYRDTLSDPKALSRTVQALARKGFSYADIRAAIRELGAETDLNDLYEE